MVHPGGDVDDVAQAQTLRFQTVDFATFDDSPSELVLLSVTPHVDMASGGQCEDVVRPARDRDNAGFAQVV